MVFDAFVKSLVRHCEARKRRGNLIDTGHIGDCFASLAMTKPGFSDFLRGRQFWFACDEIVTAGPSYRLSAAVSPAARISVSRRGGKMIHPRKY
jgi:hypothetical protein